MNVQDYTACGLDMQGSFTEWKNQDECNEIQDPLVQKTPPAFSKLGVVSRKLQMEL